jgi:hypothetical protein
VSRAGVVGSTSLPVGSRRAGLTAISILFVLVRGVLWPAGGVAIIALYAAFLGVRIAMR